jgi:hypothetical protein
MNLKVVCFLGALTRCALCILVSNIFMTFSFSVTRSLRYDSVGFQYYTENQILRGSFLLYESNELNYLLLYKICFLDNIDPFFD